MRDGPATKASEGTSMEPCVMTACAVSESKRSPSIVPLTTAMSALPSGSPVVPLMCASTVNCPVTGTDVDCPASASMSCTSALRTVTSARRGAVFSGFQSRRPTAAAKLACSVPRASTPLLTDAPVLEASKLAARRVNGLPSALKLVTSTSPAMRGALSLPLAVAVTVAAPPALNLTGRSPARGRKSARSRETARI